MIEWARKGEKMPGCLPVLQLTVQPIPIRYTMVQSSRGSRVSLNGHVYLLDPESPPKRCGRHTSYQQRAQKKRVSRGDCPERVWLYVIHAAEGPTRHKRPCAPNLGQLSPPSLLLPGLKQLLWLDIQPQRDPTANMSEPPAEEMAPKADMFDNGKSLYVTFLSEILHPAVEC